jgi:hypothetical protein
MDGDEEPPAEPEEILPEIPSKDTDPDEPDSSDPTFNKEKGKSNAQGYGKSGNPKKIK